MAMERKADPLANPGFPGVATTEAVPVGSDRPVTVKIARDEATLRLGPEEFRRASARQKALDAQEEKGHPVPPPPPPNETTTRGARPASIVKPRPKRPVASGKKSPARSTTSAPARSKGQPQVTHFDRVEALESRMSKMEQGIDKLLSIVVQQPHVNPLVEPEDTDALGIEPGCDPDLDDVTEETDTDKWLESLNAEEPETGDPELEPNPLEVGDASLVELQHFIQKRQPNRWFRRFLYPLCRNASYQEWPAEQQAQFDKMFEEVVLHPAFLTGLRRWVRKSRNGQVVGNEQLFKLAVVIAGCATIYHQMRT